MGMTQIEIPSRATRTDGWTVEIDYAAGGSFTQVIVRDTLGRRAYSRNHVFSSDAEQEFRELSSL